MIVFELHPIEEQDTTPLRFYNRCKRELAKLGIDLTEWITYKDWKADGKTDVRNDIEIFRDLAYCHQTWSGGEYKWNFILEFDFCGDADNTGVGYCYMCVPSTPYA